MPFHGGLDRGVAAHAVCVVDGAGQVVARIDARHDAAGLAVMLARLRKIAPPCELPIAIERPSGLIVDALVEAGHPVFPVHPNVVKACRPRYRAAGGKSDPGDAYMIADILRTGGHRFRPLMPLSDDIKALRALVRGRDGLVAQRVAPANQLRSLLEGFWPGAAAIFAALDSPTALAFVARYPTPDSASRLGEKRLARFMAQQAYCGRRSPAELLARLRAAPQGLASGAEADAKGEIARTLVAVLERLVPEIAKLSSHIEHAVAELPDGRIVMSFPRAGQDGTAAYDPPSTRPRPVPPDPDNVLWFGRRGRSFVPATQSHAGAARPGSRIAKGGHRLGRREASLRPDATTRHALNAEDVDTGCLMRRPADPRDNLMEMTMPATRPARFHRLPDPVQGLPRHQSAD